MMFHSHYHEKPPPDGLGALGLEVGAAGRLSPVISFTLEDTNI